MAAGETRWRTRRLWAVVVLFINVVYGYEESYTISQLSPRSASSDLPRGVLLQTSQETLPLKDTTDYEEEHYVVERSAYSGDQSDPDPTPEDITEEREKEKEDHIIVARSADRESRSINVEDTPHNNEIDNELEAHNKRKYYDIRPTKTLEYLRSEDDILTSEGFGDRLEFRFPGGGMRVPKARALTSLGPKIRPTAVQPIFATANHNLNQGRQNTDIQNIITGIVKLLNGNVNVQANSQLLNGRPGRPMNSRINNRGPPRISDVPPIPEFDKPITPPVYVPTKMPPPYPFDRPPLHGVNLPEQIVPPMSHRPGLHRPIPPWQRPRPRPPNRRPNPGLPMYKPMPPLPQDLPDLDDSKPEEELAISENETHSENNIHHEDSAVTAPVTLPETNTTEIEEEGTTLVETTTSTTTSTTTTTEKPTTTEKTTTTERTTTSEKTTTEKPTTTSEKPTTTQPIVTSEKSKTDKPTKPEKKKNSVEKEKPLREAIKPLDDKQNKDVIKNETVELESSIADEKISETPFIAPTPTDGLFSQASTFSVSSPGEIIKTSSINTQPLPTSQDIGYHPYRPRPGIVLDDPEFKPHRSRPEPAVITADTRRPAYGEIFDVTVSAIQGPGGQGASVHIENVNPLSGQTEHDDIIVSASGDQGFVSIDGKRTYLNLFDSSTVAHVSATRVQSVQQSVPPLPPPLSPTLGTGVAVPADDELSPPSPPAPRPRPPPAGGHSGHPHQHQVHQPHRPQQGYRRPQATVRIDTCIVGDDSTCDQAQNEKCRTEAGISSCQCRAGYARRTHRDPCRRVVSLVLNLRVDKLYSSKVAWNNKLLDKDSDPYQQLSYEAVRAIDSAFSMTPFSDDFVSGTVNSVHRGDQHNQGVFVNYTVLMAETAETVRPAIATDIQKHLLGVIRRRSNNVGASALWVDTPAGSVLPLTDLDECASSEINDCHPLATCTNTWGGFRCACPDTTLDTEPSPPQLAGRHCKACAPTHCNERGTCAYRNGQPHCSCNSGYYGSTCEVDGEVVGVAVGASLAAALVIALTLAALLSWSRKWSREQKAMAMGSPVFNYMAANTIKTPPVGGPPYQVSLEERMRWAQIAEAMAQATYAQAESAAAMPTRPSSAMFGGYPTLPPVPMPRMGLHHTGTMNTVASRANTAASHHNLYGYSNHMGVESTSSESSHAQELLVPRPKSRARSMHNQTGIYYDVEYENAPEAIYRTKGIPLSTYTVSRGPPFYRT